MIISEDTAIMGGVHQGKIFIGMVPSDAVQSINDEDAGQMVASCVENGKLLSFDDASSLVRFYAVLGGFVEALSFYSRTEHDGRVN